MSKEFDSKMKFRNQTSLKRLTQKRKDSLTSKPSLIAILLSLIVFFQIPIALKASLSIFCLLSENNETKKSLIFCND